LRAERKEPVIGVPKRTVTGLMVLSLVLLSGCRQGLYNQAKYQPFEASALFPDGASVRALPAHTIARGQLREDVGYYTGKDAEGQFVKAFPMEVTREVLARGRQRFNIFCSPCHGEAGVGNGMVVQRGYKKPASYLADWVRVMPPGFFVNVMTEGYGVMPSYASQVPPQDRWPIAAWIRVLISAREVPVPEGALAEGRFYGALTEEQTRELRQVLERLRSTEGPAAARPEELP
jgi:mono/diheme cytochrome c family protein